MSEEQNTGAGEGMDVADAIARFMLENSDMDVMSIVGGFTLIAEVIDTNTGQQGLFTLQDASLPMWTEYGMLVTRLTELQSEMQMETMGAMGEIYEEREDD